MLSLSVIIALLYGVIGLLFIALIVKVVLGALIGDWRGWAARSKFTQKEQLVEKADGLIQEEAWDRALGILERCFHIDDVRFNSDLIEAVSNHNLSVLSRVVLVAQRQNRRMPNLAIVEDLFLSRRELMRSYYEAFNTKRALEKKRERATPDWALTEFQAKLNDLADKLTVNRRCLESQAAELFKNLAKSGESAEITYH